MQTAIFSLLFLSVLTSVERVTLPENGQQGSAKFFVPRALICDLGADVVNVRFKKCVIPMSFARVLPEIITNLNQKQLGMSRLYERFCIDHRSKEVSIFEKNQPRIRVIDKTQAYPSTVFQRVDCHNQTQLSEEDLEMKRELAQELGIQEKSQLNERLITEAHKRIKIKFIQQPTELQLKKTMEKRRGFNKEKLVNNEYLLDNFQIGNWAHEVIGGYYMFDHLDYSHLQINEFHDELDQFEMISESTSRERRPVSWMVLFVWENQYHNEHKKDNIYHDLKLLMNPAKLNFKIKAASVDSMINSHNTDRLARKLKKRGELANNRFVFETTRKHDFSTRFRSPSAVNFIKILRRQVDLIQGPTVNEDIF